MAYINGEFIDLTSDSIEDIRVLHGLQNGIKLGQGSAEAGFPGSLLLRSVKLGGEVVKVGADIAYFASVHRNTTVPIAERTEDE